MTYEDFIHDNPDVQDKIDRVLSILDTFNYVTEGNDINPDIDDIIQIMEENPRIKRISATDDILEIYTVPIIFNIDDCDVPRRIERQVYDRHRELNYGEFVVLIKPGFMPYAMPYDCSQYNVPPMYRRYESDSFDEDNETRIYSEYSEKGIYGISSFEWVHSDVGKQLGCYEIPVNSYDEDGDDKGGCKYNVLIPHPHVNQTGYMCLGNIKTMMYDAIEINSVNFIVNLALDCLFIYNDDNPYFRMWRINPCSSCDDRYTPICDACACSGCSGKYDECKGCENFRQPSLYSLYKLRRNLLELYVSDSRIDRSDRISEMREQTERLINEYLEDNPDTNKTNFMYNLREGYIADILQDDYEEP